MQKVHDLLPTAKSALHLHILTDQPLSTCQKVLAGIRRENLDLVIALLRSEHGREVLFTLMGDAEPDWFVRYRKQLDVNAARRTYDEAVRQIDAMHREIVR